MKKIWFLLLSLLLIVGDQVSKWWISANLKGQENIVWIKNVFELEYVENTGAAFSSFSGKQGFLLVLTSIILVVAIVEYFRIPEAKRYNWMHFSFACLIAGAIGNMIDRTRLGYVVDFFYFVPINFPRFNLADCYITVSSIILIILLFFVYKEEEYAFLYTLKKENADNENADAIENAEAKETAAVKENVKDNE